MIAAHLIFGVTFCFATRGLRWSVARIATPGRLEAGAVQRRQVLHINPVSG